MSVRYGDFLFTYLLWFEDSSGNQKHVRDANAFVGDFSESPGMIGSHFYRYMEILPLCLLIPLFGYFFFCFSCAYLYTSEPERRKAIFAYQNDTFLKHLTIQVQNPFAVLCINTSESYKIPLAYLLPRETYFPHGSDTKMFAFIH